MKKNKSAHKTPFCSTIQATQLPKNYHHLNHWFTSNAFSFEIIAQTNRIFNSKMTRINCELKGEFQFLTTTSDGRINTLSSEYAMQTIVSIFSFGICHFEHSNVMNFTLSTNAASGHDLFLHLIWLNNWYVR